MERTTNARFHNNKESLVAAIKDVLTHLDPAIITRTCSRFRARIKAVLAAKEGFIK